MKTAKSIIVVLFVLLTAQIASAYYCPSTGRWLSRDPIGEPGFQTSQMASVVPSTQLAPSRWINRDPIGASGFEALRNGKATVSCNGANLYLFIGNDSILYADNLGLIKVCIRPLLLCPFTTAIVHCFITLDDGTTFAYDNHGIHADPNPNSSKRTCHDISPSSITAADIQNVVDADKKSGDWDGSKYGFLSHNCCNWVDHVLTFLGSSGVESYFPGYSLP